MGHMLCDMLHARSDWLQTVGRTYTPISDPLYTEGGGLTMGWAGIKLAQLQTDNCAQVRRHRECSWTSERFFCALPNAPCLQAAFNAPFGKQIGNTRGWHVLQSDWKELFPQDFRKRKGHKMWMMRADGYGQTGARLGGSKDILKRCT